MVQSNDFFAVLAVVVASCLALFAVLWLNVRQGQALNRETYIRELFHALQSVIAKCPENQERVFQFELVFRRWLEHHPSMREIVRDESDALERAIYEIDAHGIDEHRTGFLAQLSKPILEGARLHLVEMVKITRAQNPYGSLSGKQGNLLNTIKQAVETGNQELARTTLAQIASEFEISEKSFRDQRSRNTTSIIVSVVSVILTVVFGAMSIVLYFGSLPVSKPQ
jgi:hypothetical protein